jgi:predicted ATPase/DNA-binding SARP family transcriptional activator/Tfp pilus assembly protein PilF
VPKFCVDDAVFQELSLDKTLQVRLLGQFSLFYGDEALTTISADRQQSLLVYLLLHRQSPQPRHHIAFQLWPDSSEGQARSNLRNLLFSLRQALPDADRFIEITNLTLFWRPDAPFTLDVADFQRLCAQAREAEQIGATAEALRALETAVDLYAGELLPGNYDDWIMSLREDVRLHYQQALSRLVTLLESSGDCRAALRYAQRMIQQDPLDETAYVHLMRLQASLGDRAGVRRVYENCVNLLLRELDVDPDESTVAAYEQYLRMAVPHEPLIAPTPPPATPSTQPSITLLTPPAPKRAPRLPIPATPFVGRELELAELAQLLADPNCRLLTIMGPGGMGKTHLALQTAKGHQPVFGDGAVFVPLAAINSPDQLVFAIVSSLELAIDSAVDPTRQLLDYLSSKEMLLVLDNFEHLLDGIDLLLQILEAAPSLKFMVTSRERLNLQEEWVYALHGLPVPDAAGCDWQENSSVQLFLQMARKVQSHFTLTDNDHDALLRICRLLGGMPLAIQLAASWVRVLSLAEIAQEIKQNLEFLSVAHRNVPERHRSLRAIFDQTWALLSPQEQEIFSKLAIFHNGFSREAAETVTGATLMTVTNLLDKSLVCQNGGGRYSLHELLRHYAARNMTDPLEIGRRHSRFYLSFLHAQEGRLYSHDQIAILDAIQAELNDVLAAWQWAVDHGDEEGMHLGLHSLTFFYFRRSRFQEAAPLIEYAINAQRVRASAPSLLGRLLSRQGNFLHGLGRYAEAQAMLEESVALLRGHGADANELALALRSLGHLLDDMGDYVCAQALLEEAADLARSTGSVFGVAVALDYLCTHHWRLGRFALAKEVVEESIILYRQIGDVWGLAHALTNLANACQTPAEFQISIGLFHESLALYRKLNNAAGMSQTLNSLGYNYMVLGQYEEAKEVFAQALQIQRQQGGSLNIARTLNNQGQVAYLLGDYESALRQSLESLALRRAAGATRETAFSFYTVGLILMDRGDLDGAAKHWSESLSIFERLGQRQKMANCLNELGNVAIQRGDLAEAERLLVRAFAISQEDRSPWTEARARLFWGVLAAAQNDLHAALDSLTLALQIAIDVQETVLALDILLEIAKLNPGAGTESWRFNTLCLLAHHRQCRFYTQQQARRLLIAHGADPDATSCQQAALGEIADQLKQMRIGGEMTR